MLYLIPPLLISPNNEKNKNIVMSPNNEKNKNEE